MFKIDLHIHTPASTCYADHLNPGSIFTRPEDIVAAALRVGLAGIAITDHNTPSGVEEVRQAAPSQLVVFPGIEIAARGGHVLGLFPEDTPVDQLWRLVEAAGFSAEQQGRGYEESALGVKEVIEAIFNLGGLAIAAHIDRRPKGFAANDALSLGEKAQILYSPHLSALEITIPQDRVRWQEGRMPGLSRGLTCLQGSDAHALEEMGRRPVYLDIPQLHWQGLQRALKEGRVQFPSAKGV